MLLYKFKFGISKFLASFFMLAFAVIKTPESFYFSILGLEDLAYCPAIFFYPVQ
jgi:hypothetical protein